MIQQALIIRSLLYRM